MYPLRKDLIIGYNSAGPEALLHSLHLDEVMIPGQSLFLLGESAVLNALSAETELAFLEWEITWQQKIREGKELLWQAIKQKQEKITMLMEQEKDPICQLVEDELGKLGPALSEADRDEQEIFYSHMLLKLLQQ